MNLTLPHPLRLALWLALPVSAWAQAPLATEAAITATPSPTSSEAAAPAAEPPPPPPEGCRPLTDKAIAADMKAVTAQSQKRELAEQAQLYGEAASLWTQAAAQCEGRAKDRAQRNLADSQKSQTGINEQLGAGPQCAAAHKDAGALQELARQALGERRWAHASMLFRKAENMWDMASERCTGGQQEIANRRRDQSELDGQNAEVCAPLFEKAREQTQKLRATAAGLSREEKQDASNVAETLWRDAVTQCKGSAVQDSARNNAQALARERGTPWVARVAPAPQPAAKPMTPTAGPVAPNAEKSSLPAALPSPLNPASSNKTEAAGGAMSALTSAFSSIGDALTPAAAVTAVAASDVLTKPATAAPQAQPAEFMTGTTRVSGQLVRDADGPTYSGTGKLVWANGDVFEGTLVKSQRHGKGLFVWANGQRYNGDWVNDQAIGQASMAFANGDQYEGRVSNGVPQDQGQMRYASGDSYTGQFKAGKPDGRGSYNWKNGHQFEGEWRNERPNGLGKIKFANGNRYEGLVLDGVPSGSGRMQFATGEIYQGDLLKGEPHGQGTFNWTNGDKYSGLWKAGKKHGQGTFTWNNGVHWEGIYDNDQQTEPSQLPPKI
jgi:hypothetical protein